MYNRIYTPEKITSLNKNEIFVFGSNIEGHHGGGAARFAHKYFGAIWGVGVGLQGQSYAIPTMHGGIDVIKPYVDQFIDFVQLHPQFTFYVTKIGCGIAGFTEQDIAPLFSKAIELTNVILPMEFVEIICGKNTPSCSWNSEKDFLEKYRPLMKRVKEGDANSYSEVRKLRFVEYFNTIDLVNNKFYYTETGEKVTLNNDDKMINGTRFYSREFRVDDIKGFGERTTIEVVNADCLEIGTKLLDLGYNPAILNMASRQNPGGAVLRGAGAQEETIFRRTNLFRSLYQFSINAETFGLKKSRFQYPLDKNFGGIYSPSVTLFRSDEKSGYMLLPYPSEMAFISVAGMNRPALTGNGMIVDSLVEGIKNKIRTILRIGLKHGHDSLVLGALGCGAFCNPPRHVARLFREVIYENEFANKFKLIVFAILDDHNSHKSHNRDGNFLPFKEEFNRN